MINENVKKNVLIGSLAKARSTELFWIVSFSILTFLSAQVAVPVQPVPFTLQTMLVLLSGAFLGARNGMYSQLLYVGAGVMGLPVFAGFSFGLPVLFGPTGGYLLAFPLAAFVVGYIVEKRKTFLSVAASMVLGTSLILMIGSLFLSFFFGGDIQAALYSGLIIFSPWGLVKTAAAVSIYLSFAGKYPKLPS